MIHTNCSILGLNVVTGVNETVDMSLLVEGLFEDIPTLEESSLLTALPLIACVKLINTSLVSCVDMAQLCFSTNTGYAHEVFQVLPLSPCVLSQSMNERAAEQLQPKPPWSLVCLEIGWTHVC